MRDIFEDFEGLVDFESPDNHNREPSVTEGVDDLFASLLGSKEEKARQSVGSQPVKPLPSGSQSSDQAKLEPKQVESKREPQLQPQLETKPQQEPIQMETTPPKKEEQREDVGVSSLPVRQIGRPERRRRRPAPPPTPTITESIEPIVEQPPVIEEREEKEISNLTPVALVRRPNRRRGVAVNKKTEEPGAIVISLGAPKNQSVPVEAEEKPARFKTLQELLITDSGVEEDFNALKEKEKGRTFTRIGRKEGYEERKGDEKYGLVNDRKDVYQTEENNPFSPPLPNDLNHYTIENHIAKFAWVAVAILAGFGLLSALIILLIFGRIF